MFIGGNMGTALSGPNYLISPIIDLSSVPGPVFLQFWRWLNTDYPPYAYSTIDVYNGVGWVNIFSNTALVTVQDDVWTNAQFDVTSSKNASFKIRFGWQIASAGALSASGWNIDDVRLIPAASCP